MANLSNSTSQLWANAYKDALTRWKRQMRATNAKPPKPAVEKELDLSVPSFIVNDYVKDIEDALHGTGTTSAERPT